MSHFQHALHLRDEADYSTGDDSISQSPPAVKRYKESDILEQVPWMIDQRTRQRAIESEPRWTNRLGDQLQGVFSELSMLSPRGV